MAEDQVTHPSQPQRSRAVFTPADFGLMRTALLHYMDAADDLEERKRCGALLHRLGRVE